MVLSSSPTELHHDCSNPACGSQEVAGAKAAGGQSGPLANRPATTGAAFLGYVKRWCLWFLAFFGIYSASSVCPFCGTPGCPVGAGGAALVGVIFVGLWQFGVRIFQKCKDVAQKFCQ
ncbi:MAG: hypothetical protein PHW74_05680 [Desulfobacca sp.]|nr:hypothetical protein [Desulfobacca sp.]